MNSQKHKYGILVVLSVLILVSCIDMGQSDISKEVFFECKSSDGKYIASFYREFGGGAAGFQYEYVAVVGNDDVVPVVVMKLDGGYDVSLKWLGPEYLEIGYPESARVDHWQSWFGRMANGKVIISSALSENGLLVDAQKGCI